MPLSLSPQNIWDSYFKKLEETFNCHKLSGLKKLCISEKRNLRDQIQFNELINFEFFEKNKLGRVQVSQQLVIIYVSWFHPEIYKILRNDSLSKSSVIPNKQKFRESETSYNAVLTLLKSNNEYPHCFLKKRMSYFLSESISNLSIESAKEILYCDEKLQRIIHSPKIEDEDFLFYLETKFRRLEDSKKEELLNLALKEIKLINDNSFISLIIQEKSIQIISYVDVSDDIVDVFDEDGLCFVPHSRYEVDKKTQIEWSLILGKKGFDISQKIYFYHNYLAMSYDQIGILFEKINVDDFYTVKRQDFYILTYLSQNKILTNTDEWGESLWEQINKLSYDQYLSFLIESKLIEEPDHKECYNKSKDIVYRIRKKEYNPFKGRVDNSEIIKKYLEHKIATMIKRGYKFEFINQSDEEMAYMERQDIYSNEYEYEN